MEEKKKDYVFYHVEHLMMMVVLYFEMMVIHKYIVQASMNHLFWLYAYMVMSPVIVVGIMMKEGLKHKGDIVKNIYAIGMNLFIQYSLMIVCYFLCYRCSTFEQFFYQFLILSLISSFMSWRVWLYMLHVSVSQDLTFIMVTFLQALTTISIIFLRSSWTVGIYIFSTFIQLCWVYHKKYLDHAK